MIPFQAGSVDDSGAELRNLVSVIWRRKWIILALTGVVFASVVVFTSSQTPQYEATSLVLIRGRNTPELLDSSGQSNQEANRNLANELAFIQSDEVRSTIIDRLGRSARIQAQAQGDGDLIALRATGTDPVSVAEIANTAAEVYVELRARQVIDDYLNTAAVVQERIIQSSEERAQVTAPVDEFRATLDPNEVDEFGVPVNSEAEINAYLATLAQLESAIQADADRLDATIAALQNTLNELELNRELLQDGTSHITRVARVPTEPFEPDIAKNALIGLIAGLALGLATAFLIEALDNRVRTKGDAARSANLPVLGLVPRFGQRKGNLAPELATAVDGGSIASEAYRSLWTAIEFVGIDHPIRSMVVTSPHSSTGKTTTVANLGVTIANTGRRVVIVDCDLRLPRLHDAFGLSNEVGFTSLVLGSATLDDAVHPIELVPNLNILPSGPLPPGPADLLASEAAQTLIRKLTDEFDLVLIDSPPAIPVSDPAILSTYCDGVLVIARAKQTRDRDLHDTTETLRGARANLLGVVLNSARLGGSGSYGYGYGYGYGHAPKRSGWRDLFSRRTGNRTSTRQPDTDAELGDSDLDDDLSKEPVSS